MKKFLIIAIFIITSLKLFCQEQEGALTESTMGLQIGTFGIWVYNEAKLTNSLTLRSDLGFETYFSSEEGYLLRNGFIIPALSVEPRWYYNLKRRVRNSKPIDSNSGDFIGLKVKLNPRAFRIPGDANTGNMLTIAPLWGLRRSIGRNYNFEFGAGPGYRYNFDGDRSDNFSEFILYINLRLGIIF